MRGVDQQPPAADQVRVGALPEHRGEQLLEHRRVGKALSLRVTERRVIRQPLGQPEPEKPPDRHVGLRDLQRRAHRRQPAPREHQRELDQDRRIDARPAHTSRVIERTRRRTHMLPIDQLLNTPQLIIGGHQIVQADHLHLPRLLTRPHRKRRQRHTPQRHGQTGRNFNTLLGVPEAVM